MNAPAIFPGEAEYGVIRTRQCEGGWWEAEHQLSRLHPLQMAAGRTLESALDQLERHMKLWERR